MKPSTLEIEIVTGPADLANRAAELFVSSAVQAISERGRFCVALSGGATPLGLYALLAQPPYSGRLDWDHIHLFWGDERCVAADHADSNYGAARPALLDRVSIPPANLHRIQGELEPAQAAEAYERELKSFFGGVSLPCLDLVLLGLGEDGHTASLFPGAPALVEREHWTAVVKHRQPPPPLVSRVTLTPPVLNAAAFVLFLVSGAGKADRLAQVLHGPYQPLLLPAQIIRPKNGRLLWLIDRLAAASL